MKRIITSLVIGLSALSGQAFALVGGPFDMGSHGSGLDRNSTYQGILRFTNGSGFVYFRPDAFLGPETSVNSVYAIRGSTINRSVIYYQGVSYVGACFGTADFDTREIQGVLNASSEVSTNSGNRAGAAGQFALSGGSNNNVSSSLGSSVETNIVASGKAYLVNGNFNGKITRTSPVLRFTAKGELAFISSNGSDSINTLAYTAYSGLINAVISFVGNSTSVPFGAGGLFTDAQSAINSALADLKGKYLSAGGVDNAYKDAKVLTLYVSGTRRYF